MNDLVIVSNDETGLWQAAFYQGAAKRPAEERDALAPDATLTIEPGVSLIGAVNRAQKKWPGARIDARLVSEAAQSNAEPV